MAFSLGKNLSVMYQVQRINLKLNAIVDKCQPGVRDTMLTQGGIIAAKIKSVAPVEKDAASETAGNLRQSVKMIEGEPTEKKAIVIKIVAGDKSTRPHGGGYNYARAVEFGTVQEPAHPFFFPVYRALKAGARRAIRKRVAAEVLKVFK